MIQTEADIRQWAETIVAANGEKFTPLTKSEQYAIAKFVLELGKGTSVREPDRKGNTEPPEQNPQEPPQTAVKEVLENPVRTVTMTRGYAYHRAGFKAQEVYDKFLADAKKGNTESKVMDFSTGRQSVDAAFAYWLAQTIEVDLPPSVRTVA